MKKLFIIPTLLFAAGAFRAQTSKGNYMLGGNIGYSYNQIINNDTTPSRRHQENAGSSFNSRLSAGYFIKDNLAVGIVVGYSGTKSRFQNVGMGGTQMFYNIQESESKIISAGLFCVSIKCLDKAGLDYFTR